MSKHAIPPVIQAVGLACTPVHDMPPGEAALARQPVAAAVITLQQRDDGHREIVAARLSDARALEFPITWLVNEALMPRAPVIVTPVDRAVLAVETMARRYMAEPRLAAMCAGVGAIDPLKLSGTAVGHEAALCRRLLIPYPLVDEVEIERGWDRDAPQAAEDVALGIAIARLMLWAHAASFAAGEPDAFFETMLPLRDWMHGEEEHSPTLARAVRCRPISRATSFAETYRQYRAARDAGEADASWISFEDGLFHC